MRSVASRSPSASYSDTDAQLASRYPPPSLPFIGAITPSSDTAIVHAVSGTSSAAERTCASNRGRSSSQRADSALGSRSSKLFEGAMLPNAANTSSASRGTRCAHNIAPWRAACGVQYPSTMPTRRSSAATARSPACARYSVRIAVTAPTAHR